MVKIRICKEQQAPMTFTTSTLSNGLTVSTDQLSGNGTTINWTLRSGARHERVPGVAHFIEHATVAGNAAEGGEELYARFKQFCLGMKYSTSAASIDFYANTGRAFAPEVIATIGRAVSGPCWTTKSLERERSRILDEYAKARRNEFGNLCAMEGQTHAFAGHPVGLPVIGTLESIAGMKEQDLLDYMGDHFHAQRMGLTVSGPFMHEAVVEMAEAAFGAIPRGAPRPDQPAPVFQGGSRVLVPGDPRRQEALMVFPGFPLGSAHEYGAYRMMTLLGDELSETLRKSGSYEYAGAVAQSEFDYGTMGIFVATTPDKVRARVEAAREMAERPDLWLREDRCNELQLMKKLDFDFNGNDPRFRATQIDSHFRDFGHAISCEEALVSRRKMTFDDAVKAYAAWDRKTLNVVGCGPSEDIPTPAELTGARPVGRGQTPAPRPAGT
jgi:predicted Zn-dependent peptidase